MAVARPMRSLRGGDDDAFHQDVVVVDGGASYSLSAHKAGPVAFPPAAQRSGLAKNKGFTQLACRLSVVYYTVQRCGLARADTPCTRARVVTSLRGRAIE